MEEQHQHHDDQSHYEISLTAGQAFVAFVLLLLSLAASFAFGLMLGKGQADERLVVQKETPVVTEASVVPSKKSQGEIVELGVDDDDFKPAPDAAAATTETAPAVVEEAASTATVEATTTQTPAESGGEPPQSKAVPHYAQLLSTGDQKVAESLAAKLIDGGFNAAYVERGVATEKGPVFRVRIKFASEADARAAEPKLREFSKEVWITSR
jgi:hypothetical protein